jgi:hypothetical protein
LAKYDENEGVGQICIFLFELLTQWSDNGTVEFEVEKNFARCFGTAFDVLIKNWFKKHIQLFLSDSHIKISEMKCGEAGSCTQFRVLFVAQIAQKNKEGDAV